MYKILVVDDEPHVVQLLASRLEANKYEVVAAYDAKQAVKIAEMEMPNLIILDITLPKGGGLCAFGNLKNSINTMKIPVIFITAHTSEELKQQVLEIGAADYMIKPYDSNDLLNKVKKAIEKN